MKPQHNENHTFTGGKKLRESTFDIELSSEMFRLMSSTIYTDAKSAVVREIISNMIDSHRRIGSQDVPFDIHLPTYFDNNIRFRDYGTGLSVDKAFDVYRVYGKSDKTHDNSELGGFGLGCKSPFSYTNTFYVISFLDGISYTFEASLTDEKPRFDLLKESETNEPNGVEVRFPLKPDDVNLFIKHINWYVDSFGCPYRLFNDMGEETEMTSYFSPPFARKTHIDKNVRLFELSRDYSGYSRKSKVWVNLDGIIYPIRDNDELGQYTNDSVAVETLNFNEIIVIDESLDRVQPKPSREDIDYTKEDTVKNLKITLDKLDRNIRKDIISVYKQVRSKNPFVAERELCKYVSDKYGAGIWKKYSGRFKYRHYKNSNKEVSTDKLHSIKEIRLIADKELNNLCYEHEEEIADNVRYFTSQRSIQTVNYLRPESPFGSACEKLTIYVCPKNMRNSLKRSNATIAYDSSIKFYSDTTTNYIERFVLMKKKPSQQLESALNNVFGKVE